MVLIETWPLPPGLKIGRDDATHGVGCFGPGGGLFGRRVFVVLPSERTKTAKRTPFRFQIKHWPSCNLSRAVIAFTSSASARLVFLAGQNQWTGSARL
jgi:hypothetical protein